MGLVDCSRTMRMNRSRSVLSTINEIKAYMSTRARVQNHYETLELSPNCTQDDIKSAYYKLSKKYHPDKNTSVDAKTKFQRVSEAYEIIGNFSKRKLYDRDLTARGKKATQTAVYRTVDEHPLAGFYRSRMVNLHSDKSFNQSKFDFDEWTRAHYGESLRKTIRNKAGVNIHRKLRQEFAEEEKSMKSSYPIIWTATSFILGMLIIHSYFTVDTYDIDLIRKKTKEK